MCSIHGLGYVRRYDQYRWKWGIYYWFGMYITINYIAMMIGGDQLIQHYTRVGDYMSSIPLQYILEKMNTSIITTYKQYIIYTTE